jgi:hypothetical protein
MIREKLIASDVGAGKRLRWRSREVSRLEGLADAVFGFAITLLVVSLEVPQTFDQLLAMMRGFPAFAISFGMLLLVWYQHYAFFRRYGLEDMTTMLLNAALLFVVLFYVYPLKFVWTFLNNLILGGGDPRVRLPTGELVYPVLPEQTPKMMIIYGLGYVAVFLIFALFYLHAHRQRAALELDALELFHTRVEIESNLINVAVGLLSVGVAARGGMSSAALAGFCYFLLGPVLTVHGTISGKRRKKLEQRLAAAGG